MARVSKSQFCLNLSIPVPISLQLIVFTPCFFPPSVGAGPNKKAPFTGEGGFCRNFALYLCIVAQQLTFPGLGRHGHHHGAVGTNLHVDHYAPAKWTAYGL